MTMRSADLPTTPGTQVNDIFRTVSGVNLNIGPYDRLRGGEPVGRDTAPLLEVQGATYPRIVLKDSLGYQLDTYTSLQEAIYRAKWNVRTTGQARTPLEWRLPKAPAPARPDLTRVFPPVKHPQLSNSHGKSYGLGQNVLEIDVDDVSFVKESLDRLPYVPSLSFLRQEFLVGPKTYFQIVGTMLLHKKLLSETERRHAIYNFPGFCTGCIRMGLCYGCERSSEPHYHEDKLVKTGGGFTYYKKDRPEREMKSRNPINWKINHPDQVLKKLMEEYAGVRLEGDLHEKVKEHLDDHLDEDLDEDGSQRKRHVSEAYNGGTDRFTGYEDDGRFLPDIDPRYINHQLTPSLLGYQTSDLKGQAHLGQSMEPSIGPSDVDIELYEKEHGEGQTFAKKSGKSTVTNESSRDGLTGHSTSDRQKGYKHTSLHTGDRNDPTERYMNYERSDHRLPKYRRTDGDNETDEEEGKKDYDGDDESRGRKRERTLYKPPPPFKLKKSPKRRIESKSPFSTDRSYDLPTGQTFVPKKSSKKPTEFVDFRNVDASWKEPKKFELKKSSHKPTKFWSGRTNKKKEKSRSRSPRIKRAPPTRSPSPDSGLDTGFMTAVSDPRFQERKIYEPRSSAISPIVYEDTPSDRKRVQGRERSPSMSLFREDGTNKSELEPLREESQVIEPTEMDRVLTPSTTRIPSPASTNSLLSNSNRSNTNTSTRVTNPLNSIGEGDNSRLKADNSRLSTNLLSSEPDDDKPKTPVKREIIKKEKKPKSPIPVQPKSITPDVEPTPMSPTPEPEEEQPVSREISFVFIRDPPELPPIEVPELPDIPETQPTEYKGIKREKKLIEVTPDLQEPKKKLPPPPKPRPQIRTRPPPRKTKVAEAPVTTQELQQMVDPLDFLAKYCIINPDRLPFYERVFQGALSVQTPRYTRTSEPPKGAIVHLPPAQLSDHELNMLKDITVLNQGHCPRNEGLSAPEQYLEKLNYSIEFIKSKQDVIQTHMEKMQAEKMQFMAGMAKKWDRDIVRLDYKTKSKKKKKKKKKKKTEETDYDQTGALNDRKNFQPMKASDITDEVIVSRMDDKMMKKIKKDPTYLKYKMEIGRDIEKLKHYNDRISQIEDEKDLVGLYCMDYYFSEQGAMSRPHEFRRQQSRLYQKLHPDPDIEMNIEEVEPALQQINNKLLTEREFQYIYFILNLPRREKINFRLFSIIAALSEKVTQMDPVIRKLINKVDYNALDVKLEKSKELFQLLQDERVLPRGNAPSENLAVELTAGGLTPEHTNYVMSKFDREGRGFIDFLDFVTYVPLFIEIHNRIIEDPFNDTLTI